MAARHQQRRNLRIDFAGLMGDPPPGFVAYVGMVRTDTADPSASFYTDDVIVDSATMSPVVPDATGAGSIDLIPSADFHTPMQYILRVGPSEVLFSMPDADSFLLDLLTSARPPPVHPSDDAFYLAAGPDNTLDDADLAILLLGGTVSGSSDSIRAPMFSGNDNYLFYAQPASIADLTTVHAIPARRNSVSFWEKRADSVTIDETRYNVWITKTIVFDSESERRYQFLTS